MTATITPRALAELQGSGAPVSLIDVRTPAEFDEFHVDFARNVPLDTLRAESLKENGVQANPLYVVCRSGGRGKQACEQLQAAGVNAVNVEGGTLAWEKAGLTVTRGGSSVMSLERQVRIAAGVLVVAGVLLGATVHPVLYGLAAFVGAGLVFAGVTDSCGLGMLLARMPWNRAKASGNAVCSTR